MNMSKEELEKYIYDTIVTIAVERHLSREELIYTSLYEEVDKYFIGKEQDVYFQRFGQNRSYIDENGYIDLRVCMNDLEVYIYTCDIEITAMMDLRENKLNDLLG